MKMQEAHDDPVDLEMQLLSTPHDHKSPMKSFASSPHQDEKAVGFVDEDQIVPLLQTVDKSLHLVENIRTLGHVIRYCIVLKEHAALVAPSAHVHRDSSGATEAKPEGAEASASVAAPPDLHPITIDRPPKHIQIKNISKIVGQKNLRALDEFGGVDGVVNALGTDSGKGISDQEYLHQQQELYLIQASTRPFFHLIREEVKKKTVLLFMAAVLSTVFEIDEQGLENGGKDGIIVIIAILVQVLISSIHKYRKQQIARKKLQKLLENL